MKEPIDEIKIIYTPKKQMELQTFHCFYPIIYGNGSCTSIGLKHLDGSEPRYTSIMEANVEYLITITVYSFAKWLDFDKSSHPY